ncbi:glutathione S-transferase [Aureimonas endophytica]|uniref:Glutathione S-transferase n=1 Tax=Aureimonas endophytica TaxID=2027858 RepID=A0A916ZBG6_9HYPH|nr:glutathione S-transferase family protein [Aureimonas endophytica]GGD86195.1 glutathione S-transferase [Aureimonas endophytica]
MSAELVFYTNPMSRGRMVRWMLEELGQPYRAEILGYGEAMKGDYRRLNPMGKVPALAHGEVIVTEVAAICLYLADAFPQAGLAPAPASTERGAYYRWTFFAAGPLEAAVTNRALGVVPTEDQRRFVGYGSYETTLDALESHLAASDYVTGGHFTAADVYVGSHVGWGLQFGTLERRPAFEAYWDRLKDRPAAVRAREIDDALIAKAKQGAA